MTTQSRLFDKVYGAVVGGTIGDAIGGPVEMMHYQTIRRIYGKVVDLMDYGEACQFGHAGFKAGHWTDDSILKMILCDAIIRVKGRITAEDWAESWRKMFNPKDFYIAPVNTFFRLVNEHLPAREIGRGNMQANGSAMCIAPVGIINAGSPYQAAYDTYEVGAMLHTGLAREGAAAIAAAVAEAFNPAATPDTMLDAAVAYLTPHSGAVEILAPMLALARSEVHPEDFISRFYDQFVKNTPYRHLATELIPEGYMETVDAMETVGAALGLFYVCKGDAVDTLVATANFGHDCDTIGAISGSLAGAYQGASHFPERWLRLVDETNQADHKKVTAGMVEAILANKSAMEAQIGTLNQLLEA